MNTATATATEERALTEREAMQAIEAFQISLTDPRVGGGRWIAGWKGDGRRVLEFGKTAIEAVENVLQGIGVTQ